MLKKDMLICAILATVGVGYLLGAGYHAVTYDSINNNCKHQSIEFHDWLAEHGIESHYAGERVSPTEGHVWIIVAGVPIETTNLGIINPLKTRRYLKPDWTFTTTEDMLIHERKAFKQT